MSDQLAVTTPVMASTELSAFLGIEKGMMIDTIKRQCFKNLKPDEVTDAQLASFISVARQFKVNVMLPGFLYAYPERNGGIQVMIGPDLMFKLISEHPEVDSWETEVFPEDVTLPPTHATTKIWRKGRERPVVYTALLSEWRVQSNPNWQTRPRHMLGIRSLKQAGRQIVHGLPMDEDERKIAEMVNVTDSAGEDAEQPKVKRTPPPQRELKGAAAVKENVEKLTSDAIEAKTTVVADKPAETSKVAAEPSKEAARTSLNENESITGICTVESFTCKSFKVKGVSTPSVVATVKGDYQGEVVHLGGATLDGEKLKENPAWQIESAVTLKLLGKKNNVTGKVAAAVESIAIAEGQSASPAEEFGG